MFTNEQIDKLLTNYKECGLEISKTGGKYMYSTVLRGDELLSVRKDLVKDSDRLLLNDGETLAIIASVDSIVRSKGLVQFRKVFPSKFKQVLTQSSVYLGGVGKVVDVSEIFNLVGVLRNNVARLNYYTRLEVKLSEEYVNSTHGKRLEELNLKSVGNKLVSTKYTKEIEYILTTNYTVNLYKVVTKDRMLLSLLKTPAHSESALRVRLIEKGYTSKVSELKDELVRSLARVNEYETLLSNIVVETGKLSRESDVNVINGYISDSERLLQDCIEQDLSGISAGLHSEKLQRLSNGKELDNNYIIIQPLLDELYSVDSMKNNRLTFDLEYYLNEAVITYGRENWLKTRKLDYYGHLVGDSKDVLLLTEDEAEALNELISLIHKLFMYVYKNEKTLANV